MVMKTVMMDVAALLCHLASIRLHCIESKQMKTSVNNGTL